MRMKPCIYMVDDEPDFQAIVRSWLEPTYEAVSLKDAEELTGALRSRTPDLVILDLHLTASREFEDYRKSMGAGGSGYLMKPVGRRQLMRAVDELLSEGRVTGRNTVDTGGGD